MISSDEALKDGRRGGRTHVGLAVMGAASVLLAVVLAGFTAGWALAKQPDGVAVQPKQPAIPAAGAVIVRAENSAATATKAPLSQTTITRPLPTVAPVEAVTAPKATPAPLSELATLVRAPRRTVKRAPRVMPAPAPVNTSPAAAPAPASSSDDNDSDDEDTDNSGSGSNSGSGKNSDSGDNSGSSGKGK